MKEYKNYNYIIITTISQSAQQLLGINSGVDGELKTCPEIAIGVLSLVLGNAESELLSSEDRYCLQ